MSTLFDLPESTWEKEWKDMPEFVQIKKEPYAMINIRFESKEDLDEFSKLIGQKFTKKSKSAWYPFRSHWGNNNEIYTNEK